MFARSTRPLITGISPRAGSPHGGVIITISGENLKSKQLDLGTGSIEESENQGENFKVWFEKEDLKVQCRIDRMLTLHADSMDGLGQR